MSSDALWCDGWLNCASHCPSPNFGPRPAGSLIDLVVIHSISLPPGIYGGGQVAQLFTNQLDWDAHPYFKQIEGMEVSAHFFIDRQGQIVQFVSCDQRAWHAGKSCFEGRDNCNDYSVGIELEGLEGQCFDASQYQTLSLLITHISEQYPIQNVVGHEHIARGRKFDPGAGFDWLALQPALDAHKLRGPNG